MTASRTILICQHNACRKAGASKVLAAFQHLPVPAAEIKAVRCLEQCGNGPMVLVLPEQIWYHNVHPDEVPAIVKCHLQGGQPIRAMLYRKFHPN